MESAVGPLLDLSSHGAVRETRFETVKFIYKISRMMMLMSLDFGIFILVEVDLDDEDDEGRSWKRLPATGTSLLRSQEGQGHLFSTLC